MNWKHVKIVIKKELKDLFRDRKTIFSSIILPAVIVPVLMMLIFKGAESTAKRAVENIKIAIQVEGEQGAIREFLENNILNQSEDEIEVVELSDPEEALKEDEIRAILKFQPDFLDRVRGEETGQVTMLYNDASSKSEIVINKISDLFEKYRQQLIYERVAAQGVDTKILDGIVVETQGIGDKMIGIRRMLSFILPFLLVVYPISGAMPAATDLIAGEKERGTLEPLLTTQPNRISLLVGKLITVTIFSVLSVVSYGLGMLSLPLFLPKELISAVNQGGGDTLVSSTVVILMIVIGVLLALMAAGLLLAISTFARSFKEAQSYMAPIIFVVMVPAYITMMWDVSDFTTRHFFIPIFNAVALMKELIISPEIIWSHVGITIISTLVFVAGAITYCVYVFNREQALFRS